MTNDMVEKTLSKRLKDFVGNHMEYFDDGNPESGPHLDSYYVGPDWAMDMILEITEPGIAAFYSWYEGNFND